MTEKPIVIAGAGIAGLAAALALAKIGRRSLVLERSPVHEAAGAGLQLGPNAVKALQQLGAWEEMKAHAVAPDTIDIRDGLTGMALLRIPLGLRFDARFGQPYRVAHRRDLLNALLRQTLKSDLIELRMNSPVDGAITSACDILIGADGYRSSVRGSVATGARLEFRNQVIYRALLSGDEKESSVVLWLCPGGHVVHYPVSGGRELNLVAIADRERIGEQAAAIADHGEVETAFAGVCEELRGRLLAARSWLKWPAAELTRLAVWSRAGTALIGDAAHACLPYLAQGAAMALEDAVVMAARLKAVDTPEAAFRAYEAERRPRVERVRIASARLVHIYHARGPFRLARNAVLRAAKPERFLDRLAWLYGFEPPEI